MRCPDFYGGTKCPDVLASNSLEFHCTLHAWNTVSDDSIQYFHYTAPVSILSLQESSTAVFTLNCSTSGSPPTNVTWIKDGQTVSLNGTFTTDQYLRDGVTARYDSVLMVLQPPSEVIGTYTCSVDNSVSIASQETLLVQGKWNK